MVCNSIIWDQAKMGISANCEEENVQAVSRKYLK